MGPFTYLNGSGPEAGTTSLGQCTPIELYIVMEIFHIWTIQYGSPRHIWLLSTRNVASATEKPNFKLCFILINLNSHTGLVTTVLDRVDLRMNRS